MKCELSRRSILLICLLTGWNSGLCFAEGVLSYDERYVTFSERVVVGQLIGSLSDAYRADRERCEFACAESGAMELAIGLIGTNRSAIGDSALLNLLGLRLDGAAAEDRDCLVVARGREFLPLLEGARASDITAHCHAIYLDLSRHELRRISDVAMSRVCRSGRQVQKAKEQLIDAIKLGEGCE